MRFNDTLSDSELDDMLYSEVHFRGSYIFEERRRLEKERLTAASFSAYQLLAAKTDKLPPWGKYLRSLGLSDEPEVTEEDLKREAEKAMENVSKIISKAQGNGGR